MRLVVNDISFFMITVTTLGGPEAVLVERKIYVRDQGCATQNHAIAMAIAKRAAAICIAR